VLTDGAELLKPIEVSVSSSFVLDDALSSALDGALSNSKLYAGLAGNQSEGNSLQCGLLSHATAHCP